MHAVTQSSFLFEEELSPLQQLEKIFQEWNQPLVQMQQSAFEQYFKKIKSLFKPVTTFFFWKKRDPKESTIFHYILMEENWKLEFFRPF